MRSPCLPVFLLAALLVAVPRSSAAQSGAFGNSVVIDGDALLIGEPNNSFRPGTVYVYRKQGGTWVESAQITAPDAERSDGFGAVLALNGNTLFVATRGGAVLEYVRSGQSWRYARTVADDDTAGLDPRCDFNGYCGVDYGLSLATAGE